MDIPVDKFIEVLLTPECAQQPSDIVKPEQLELELPPWFDEKQFNRGRKFFWTFSYSCMTSMLTGLVAVFSIPSILKVLVGSHRSNSVYTAYKRYLSTLLHTVAWFEHDLKPGSTSWRSLFTVRSRHLRAGMAAKLHGHGTVSQRDIALTQFGFLGFLVLKPDHFGVRALTDDDWEGYNHFWRTIGYMIGLEDRYNICRATIDETREVCQILLDRVITPCLENPPEYFEHMSRVMLEGMWYINPTANCGAMIYHTKYLADVPGFVYTEAERIRFQRKLKKQLKGKALDTAVDSKQLIANPGVEGLPEIAPRLHYYKDYQFVDETPAYKNLTFFEKYKLAFYNFVPAIYSTWWGRWYLNLNFLWSLFLMKYCPYMAFYRFGVKESLVNIFTEDPVDETKPLPNSHYYKINQPMPWYREWLSLLW